MSDITVYSEQTFESIKHVNEHGQEYWLARELQSVLEYAQWRRFSETVERAIDDVMLSRYACYLIVMRNYETVYVNLYHAKLLERYMNRKQVTVRKRPAGRSQHESGNKTTN